MRILETMKGATEITVFYESNTGERITVTRPRIFTLSQIISEIEETEKNSDSGMNKGNIKTEIQEGIPSPVEEEGKTTGKTLETPSIFDSNEPKEDKGENTPKRLTRKQGGN